jgi:hypothetical protein
MTFEGDRLRSQRNSKRQLLEPVEVTMSKPTLDMWDQILTIYNDVLSQAEASYLAKAKSKLSKSINANQ